MTHKRPTQAQRVLNKLKEVGEEGVWHYEFVNMKPPILRYSARIKELRDLGHQIQTKIAKTGYYKYFLKNQPTYKVAEVRKEPEPEKDEYENGLESLRARYRIAKMFGNEDKMKKIHQEAIEYKKFFNLVKNAQEIFGA